MNILLGIPGALVLSFIILAIAYNEAQNNTKDQIGLFFTYVCIYYPLLTIILAVILSIALSFLLP
jgi:uncharacterized membrane protein YhdT